MILFNCDIMNSYCKFLILTVILVCCSCNVVNKNDSNDIKDNIIDEIVYYNKDLDISFLNYIYDNYELEVLEKILLSYKENNYNEELWHTLTGKSFKVLIDYYLDSYRTMDNIKIIDTKDTINISFVGDISLADNFDIMPYYDSRGKKVYGILSEDTVDIMKKADIMVANNEFAVTNSDNRLDKYYTFKAKPERLSIYKEMGVDLVSIANNHVYDYDEEGFFDTLKYLKEYDIPYVGGGKDIDEAKKAYYYIANGYKISFISATRAEKYVITPKATSDNSGVFWAYEPEDLINTIKEEKEKSDYVILLIHWGKEDTHSLEDVQIETGHRYIDAGADLIVGSHAHVLQGYEMYNNKLIAYNLGDFIFNRETKYTGILSANFTKNSNIEYKFIPCIQDNYKTSILNEEDKIDVINLLNDYSNNIVIDNNGTLLKKS